MGTLNYMAPEQGRDGKCDVRSDIYSLGIAYYEMLTGSVPFDADTPLAILMKHLNDPLPLPRTLEPSIPETFERVALKALAKNPEDRYQSADEMSAAINTAAQETGISVPDATTLPQTMAVPRVRPAPVVVFSGNGKSKIVDDEFAFGDTDIKIKPLKHESVQNQKQKSRGALTWVTLMVFTNMVMLWASGVFGWDVFGHTWPMELIMVGVLFFLLMVESSSPWLLIPGGMLLGNGLLLAYYALTGRWEDWAIFWPLEPLIVAGSIIAPFWLTRQSDGGRAFVRWFGIGVLVVAGITLFISMAVAILQSL
jgi:hypothetical protein